MEVGGARPTTAATGRPATDCRYGSCECDVGEERIAAELKLKLGISVSPRTVRRYMPRGGHPHDRSAQRWSTFVRNHAGSMLACDFFVSITASVRTLSVFVVLDIGTRRILHWSV